MPHNCVCGLCRFFSATNPLRKLEIHKVFLRFHSKFLTQNSSPNLLVELCGVVLEFGVVKFVKYRLWYRFSAILWSQSRKWRTDNMYEFRNVRGHVEVYDNRGQFLFSADNEKEAREELEEG